MKVYSSAWLNIGICFDGPMLECNYYLRSDLYAFVTNEAKLLDPKASTSRYKSYGVKCNDNDIVEMIIDFDKRTIKYIINGKDYGVAFKELPKRKYRPLVHMYNTQWLRQLPSAKLISYNSC